MSDSEARSAAEQAVRRYAHQHQGQVATQHLPGLIAAALDAYVKAREVEHAGVAVRLLAPKPGDVVVFHFDELLSQQEVDEFAERMKPATKHLEGVKFIAVDRVADITIVRAEGRQEQREAQRHAEETEQKGEAVGTCTRASGFWVTPSETIEGVGRHGTIASDAHRCVEQSEHDECRCRCGAQNTTGREGLIDGQR